VPLQSCGATEGAGADRLSESSHRLSESSHFSTLAVGFLTVHRCGDVTRALKPCDTAAASARKGKSSRACGERAKPVRNPPRFLAR